MTDTVEDRDQGPDIVRVSGVSKRFIIRKDQSLKERIVTLGRMGKHHREDFWALRDVDLNIRAGATVGLIGHNGSGKSTLLKVIGGIVDPTSGSVERRGRLAALLELGAGFHPDLTGRENVFLNAAILGLSRHETEKRFDDIVAFADIGDFIDSQVKFYSSGMYVRLAFAVAVHTDPDLLLVDEVLAVGDEAFQRKCMDKIRSFQAEGRTIVLVTHNLGQVVELCDRAILLDRGNVVYDGEPREGVAQFRDILEDRRAQSAAAQSPDPTERARDGASILSVTAAVIADETRARLHPGDDLEITMTFSHPGIEGWIAAVQIDNSMGQVVYGTTTKRVGMVPAPLNGRRDVSLRLEDCRFGAGKYFVNVSFMNLNGVHLADAPQAASFDAADNGLAVGTTYALPRFSERRSQS